MLNERGATVIELMIVLVIIAILSSVAMPMYADYTKKARTAEVPLNLKKIVEGQIAFFENPENHRYATLLSTIGWSTSSDKPETTLFVEGTYYDYTIANQASCTLVAPMTGLAMASAKLEYADLVDWVDVCMDAYFVISHQ